MVVFAFIASGFWLAKEASCQCSNCPCPISGFTPLSSDPLTQTLESGNISTDGWEQNLVDAFFCLGLKTQQAGGTVPRIISGMRTLEYQRHLREVWDKKQLLTKLSTKQANACSTLINDINAEFRKHAIVSRPASGTSASSAHHVQGKACDISLGSAGIPISTLLNYAASCNLCRPWPVGDTVHFEVCPSS